MSKVIGIDISKQTFDACFLEEQGKTSKEFTNDPSGFKQLSAGLCKEDHLVMEATGPYYLKLACYLFEQGYKVSVVNPLVIKRFCQMRLSRAKTDKKDAYLIACYALSEKPVSWSPPEQHVMQINQGLTFLEGMEKQKTMLSNQFEAFSNLPKPDKIVISALKSAHDKLEKQTLKIEKHLQDIVKAHYEQTNKRLQTIPGIGPKSALLLIAITNNFENFSSGRQLTSYLGLSPRTYQSGTSVKGKGKICKMGKSNARKVLYVCSWSAKRYNKECKKLYERLIAKGKPERVIKIAIANKLVRMAFAVGKSLKEYDKNYERKICF
jgi:transposase